MDTLLLFFPVEILLVRKIMRGEKEEFVGQLFDCESITGGEYGLGRDV
jgi:hypothetical protein